MSLALLSPAMKTSKNHYGHCDGMTEVFSQVVISGELAKTQVRGVHELHMDLDSPSEGCTCEAHCVAAVGV